MREKGKNRNGRYGILLVLIVGYVILVGSLQAASDLAIFNGSDGNIVIRTDGDTIVAAGTHTREEMPPPCSAEINSTGVYGTVNSDSVYEP